MKNSRAKVSIESLIQTIMLLLFQFLLFAQKIIFYAQIKPLLIYSSIIMAMLLIAIKFKTKKISLKKLLFDLAGIAIGILLYEITGNNVALFVSLITPSLQEMTIKKVARNDLLVKAILFLIIIFLFAAGLTEEVNLYRGDILRMSLGFKHPNSLGFFLVASYIDIAILTRKRAIKIITLIIVLLLSILADSRSAIILSPILLLASFLENTKPKRIVAFAPIFMLVLTIAATSLYIDGNPLMYDINKNLSGRLSLQSYYQKNYEIKLFGQPLDYTNIPLDNAYYGFLYNLGLIGTIYIVSIYCKSIHEALKTKNTELAIILISLSVYALVENSPFKLFAIPITLNCFCNNSIKAKNE